MRWLLVFASSSWLGACIGDLADGGGCPDQGVAFDPDVTYLVARDCSRCHSKGEYGVRLQGDTSDYSEIMRYVVPFAPETGDFLAWAAGDLGSHPNSWSRASGAHACVATWIEEGTCAVCPAADKEGTP